MINRPMHLSEVAALLKRYPVVAVTGARQVGKTTLAGLLSRRDVRTVTRFDLEDPDDLARLVDPMFALREIRGLVIIDEAQLRPELFGVLRVLADRRPLRTRFLILGSASIELIQRGAESLAGRIAYYELPGLSIAEVGRKSMERLWLRGGFPRSFLAATEAASYQWRRNFTRSFLERDLPQLGVRTSAETMRRLWTMIAHWHGQLWNSSEIGRAFGAADTTVRNYLDQLTSTLVVTQLSPWHENTGKRQVKAPRVYIRDSGLLHSLLGVARREDLLAHPKVGASWEGFMLHQVLTLHGAQPGEFFFWRTHNGAELDLLLVRGRERLGFEFKRSSAPSVTPSMMAALTDLRLKELTVIHAGDKSFPLRPRIRAVAAADYFAG